MFPTKTQSNSPMRTEVSVTSPAGSVSQCGLFSVNFGGKLPLTYYNLINEEISRRDDGGRDYGLIPGINQDVPNPNALNRPLAWPIKIKTSVSTTDQVRGYGPSPSRIWKKGHPSSHFSNNGIFGNHENLENISIKKDHLLFRKQR